ncbi:MAG: ArsR family transcriptional regulator [Zetaproteobacteria bacterium]|nr:MAG: ArsR family transcriptional regulator [Zetaproteobacteria bacterium]
MELVARFKGLADSVRLRIARLLCYHEELCVCHLTRALALPQSTVSRHLNIMRHSGLVAAERRGKWVYYRAVREDPMVASLLALIAERTASDPVGREDCARLGGEVPCDGEGAPGPID